MDNKKFIIGVILLLLLMIGGTYAYYKWSSSDNMNVNVKIDGGTVTFNGGSNITSTIIPTASKEEGIKRTKGKYVCIVDRKKAIEHAIKMANKNDIIVLAGKGHEPYQEINGTKYPFDERIIVKEIIG